MYLTKITRYCSVAWVVPPCILVGIILSSCNRAAPEIPDTVSCAETIKVTQRNGVDVVQTVSGLYVKAKARGFDYICGRTPETRHLVDSSRFDMFWANGQFQPEIGPGYTAEQWSKLTVGQRSKSLEQWLVHGAYINGDIGFGSSALAEARKQRHKTYDWWRTPAIPHKLYPIDLLPNFRLEEPDPNAGIGPIKTLAGPFWAVRGTLNPATKFPYTTRCSIKPPLGNKPGDVAYQLDPKWILVGETYLQDQSGNTCRGGVSADNGVDIGGRLDVPGIGLPEIDKIYKAVAKLFSELIVE